MRASLMDVKACGVDGGTLNLLRLSVVNLNYVVRVIIIDCIMKLV